MNRTVIIFCCLFLLSGCSNPDPYWENKKVLTNEEISKQIQFCNSKNLMYVEFTNSRLQIVAIDCY